MLRIAAGAYRPQWSTDWAGVATGIETHVAEARRQGADLAVFPEYAGVQAVLTRDTPLPDDPLAWVRAMSDRADDWRRLHSDLARAHGLHVLAGSLTVATDRGFVNRAFLCAPSGKVEHQDKLIPTPFERDEMGIIGGAPVKLFDTALGKIGILICYDSEFPLLARQLVAAGADMILVPSCTEFTAGQTRVRSSARARAIESQCLIVQAPLVGAVPGCSVADIQTGRAGLFVPPDHGLPPDGILAQGDVDVPGWTLADVDLSRISLARTQGQVGNFAHWDEQIPHVKPITTAQLL